MNPLIKYIFYITSLSEPRTSETVIVSNDSIRFYYQGEYVTKKIVHKEERFYLFPGGYVGKLNFVDMEICVFASKTKRSYKIRKEADLYTQN